MSDQEQFLTRWSRRKRTAKDAAAPERAPAAPDASPAPPAVASSPKEPVHSGAAAAPAPPFDPATLPPIESITAATDVRPFLAPGVPTELTRAALRRVWTTDPSIRDFVGLADYDWDFNTPGAMPGFGPIEMTAQLRSEIARMVGRSLASDESEPSGQPPKHVEISGFPEQAPAGQGGEPPWHGCSQSPEQPAPTAESERDKHLPRTDVAAQEQDDIGRVAPQRKRLHGRALPRVTEDS